MASITWQGLTGFVQTQVAALQAAASAVIDATRGSITLAWAQAVTGAALWLQAQAAQAIALTRFQTSFGPDADSWGAQFDFDRLGATFATGQETFSRFTATVQAVVLAGTVQNGTLTGGAIVSTGPGGQQYMVTVDTTNPAWNATLNGYVLPPGTSSVTVPIRALVAGSAANVLAGTINSFVQPIVGIDSVTNGGGITNGLDAESDPNYKARFPVFLDGLNSANDAAIQSAIQGVQQGLQYFIVENQDYPGLGTDDGSFFVIINDGSGSPPSTLLALVSAAIQAIRGFTIRFQGAFAPSLIAPTISLNVRAAAGFTQGGVEAAALAAVVSAVNATPLDALELYVSTIDSAAKAVPGCSGVQPGSILINGANLDLVMTALQLPLISASHVSVGSY